MQAFPFLTTSYETEIYSLDVTLCIGKLLTLHCVLCNCISVIIVRTYRDCPKCGRSFWPAKVKWLVANYWLGLHTSYEAIHFPERVFGQHFFVRTAQWGGSLSVTSLKQLYTWPNDTAIVAGVYGTLCLERIFSAAVAFCWTLSTSWKPHPFKVDFNFWKCP